MDLNIIKGKEEESFKKIAEQILFHYAKQTHNSVYRILNIEFYWNDGKEHEDKSTYKRIHVKPKEGEWFFHYSGVDIALKNDIGYGGILIRDIQDLNPKKDEKEIYRGPQVCAMRLFSCTNAFESSIQTKLIPHSFDNGTIKEIKRKNLGDNAKNNNMHIKNYAFKLTFD